MSWPRKSSGASLTGNITSGSGIVPRSVQLDFDKEEKKIQQLEQTNKKFYKDVKCYVEKIDELNRSETKMITNLSNLASPVAVKYLAETNGNFKSDELEFLDKLRDWKEMLGEHNSACDSLKVACQTQVIEPMKKLNSMFPQVYEAIKRRQNAFNELCKQQSKLDKALEKERTGIQIVKIEQLKQLVATCKHQFEREHSLLMEELPKLYNSRVDFIRPCVSALLESQAQFYASYSNFYESVLSLNHIGSFGVAGSEPPTNKNEGLTFSDSSQDVNKDINSLQVDNIDSEIQKCLSEIRSLSIVSGD